MTNKHNSVLYTGVTNNLKIRYMQHKSGLQEGFTSKYKINKLVYFEHTTEISSAIAREKQIKAGNRKRKLEMIIKQNPNWKDLGEDWLK